MRLRRLRVLPMLHSNGYKMANPTVLGRLGDEELTQLFTGYRYKPYFVEGDDPEAIQQLMAATVDAVIAEIHAIQDDARSKRSGTLPVWPLIVLRSPKGWTGPKFVDGKPVEGRWRAHQVPVGDLETEPEHKILDDWMKGDRPRERFDESGRLVRESGAGPRRRPADGSEPTCQWRPFC
jgi:xylulose-5-phosphate/fructose-6-phosphate phosphoketolase